MVVFTNFMLDDRLIYQKKETDFKNCVEVILNAPLTSTEGSYTFCFSFLLTVAYLNGHWRHKIWKILFPSNGKGTAVLYPRPGIWTSGLHCLHSQSNNTATNSRKRKTAAPDATQVHPFPFGRSLSDHFQIMKHVEQLTDCVVLWSDQVAWNHLKTQLFSLNFIKLIQSFHHNAE